MSDEPQRIRELVDSFEMLKAQRERIRSAFDRYLHPPVLRWFNTGQRLTDEEVAALTSSSPQRS
jgi:hypothetical protein